MKLEDFVSFERKGYRDVYWCPTLNEPVILIYEVKGLEYHPICNMCQEALPQLTDNADDFSHTFIVHILKPR